MSRIIFALIFIFFISDLFAQEIVPLLPADSFAIEQAHENAEKYKKTGDKKEESRYYDIIGLIYWEHNYFKESIKYYELSVKLNEQLSNQSGVSMIDHNLGMICADMRQYENSLSHFKKALNYRRMVKEKRGIITVLINVSVVLNNLKQYDESVAQLNEALTLARELNDMEQMKSCYGMLSETYEKAKNSEKAYYYFELYRTFHEQLQENKVETMKETVKEKELQLQLVEVEKTNQDLKLKLAEHEIKRKDKNINQLDSTNKTLYQNLTEAELQRELLSRDAQIAETQMRTDQAIKEKQKIQIVFLSSAIILIIIILFIIIYIFRKTNILNKVIEERNRELEKLTIAASETDNAIMITDINGLIEWINYGYSKIYGKTLVEFLDKKANVYQTDIGEEGKESIQKTINNKKTHIFEHQIKSADNVPVWIQTTVTPIFENDSNIIKRLVFIDSDISLQKESEARIQMQKTHIEAQAKSMTASINYALLIQQAMLMKGKRILKWFEQSFILHLPRNVVSGDFYWSTKSGDYTIIVSADCTGHGVPGAFMSMIGMNLLNQIVDFDHIVMPNEILKRLDEGIRFSLNQEKNGNMDGMDASICTIDRRNKKMYLASSNQDIYYFTNSEMQCIKGDWNFIGGGKFMKRKDESFTLHTIEMLKGTKVYLFSDGFPDQFGSEINRKLGKKRMQSLIQDNYTANFSEQGEIYKKALLEWQGAEQQTDDILFIGFQIDL